MKLLKISAAGGRGIVGEGMTAEIAIRFAQAFSTYLEGGVIAISRDSRPSRLLMRSAVVAGSLSCGSRVIDLGVVPSPSVRGYLAELGATGAVIIAAGHNPVEWNALKFLRSDGMDLSARQGEELLEIYHHGEYLKANWEEFQPLQSRDGALDHHRRALLELFGVQRLRSRKFKVAVDCCNGTCSRIVPLLLEELGCEVVSLNDDPDKPFPHPPNPTPDNLSQLEAVVRATQADIGFGYGVEGERLGIVTENGTALHQELVPGLALQAALATGLCRGPVVVNLSTSRLIDKIAGTAGLSVHRTPVGQAYVAETALRVGADFAGEGSGQVILPALHPGPDAIAATVLILDWRASSGRTVGDVAARLPRFHMIKTNVPMPPRTLYSSLQRFRRWAESESRYQADFSDGIKLEDESAWVHVRASSTESMLRIISESEDEKKVKRIHQIAKEVALG